LNRGGGGGGWKGRDCEIRYENDAKVIILPNGIKRNCAVLDAMLLYENVSNDYKGII